MCADGSDIVITQMNQILNRWKDYFCTILNLVIDGSFCKYRMQPTRSDIQTDVEISPMSYSGVCSMINKLEITKQVTPII